MKSRLSGGQYPLPSALVIVSAALAQKPKCKEFQGVSVLTAAVSPEVTISTEYEDGPPRKRVAPLRTSAGPITPSGRTRGTATRRTRRGSRFDGDVGARLAGDWLSCCFSMIVPSVSTFA